MWGGNVWNPHPRTCDAWDVGKEAMQVFKRKFS